MHQSIYRFAWRALRNDAVKGKSVLEVGAQDINGSLRPILDLLGQGSYIGTDACAGPGVDLVCPAEKLVSRFGTECFDLVICTEMLEHAPDWRGAVENMKAVLRPGGQMLVTTRSVGFGYHGFPYDYWRFGVDDFEAIFSDFTPRWICPDPQYSGVFFWGQRSDGNPFTPDRKLFAMEIPHGFQA